MGSAGSKAARTLPKTLPKTLSKDGPKVEANKTSVSRASEQSPTTDSRPNLYEQVTTPINNGSSNDMSQRPDGGDPQESQEFAERLKQLGQVKFHEVGLQYTKENSMLTAVNRRNELADNYKKSAESGSARIYVSPTEIREILQALKDGKPREQILSDLNIESSVLDALARLQLTSDLLAVSNDGKVTIKADNRV